MRIHFGCSLVLLLIGIATIVERLDAQTSWEPIQLPGIGMGLPLVVNASGDLLVRTDTGTVYRSGNTWLPVIGLGTNPVNANLLPSGSLLVRCKEGTFISEDGGVTWEMTSRLNASNTVVSSDAVYTGMLVAGNVWQRTTDDGRSMSMTAPLSDEGYRLYADKSSPLVIGVAQTTRDSVGIWISSDRGESWSETSFRTRATYFGHAEPGPSGLFVSVRDVGEETWGVYRSVDSGVTWKRVAGLAGAIGSISFPTASTIIAGLSNGTYVRSLDEGETWETLTMLGFCPDIRSVFLRNVVVSPSATLFAYNSGGLWQSTDAGETWDDLGFRSAAEMNLREVGGALFAFPGRWGAAWRSTDLGETWNCMHGVPEAIDSGGAWLISSPMRRSTDMGLTWDQIEESIHSWSSSYTSRTPVVARDGTIFAAYDYIHLERNNIVDRNTGVMYYSSDSTRWYWSSHEEFTDRSTTLFLSPSGILYSRYDTILTRSTDDGSTWQIVDRDHLHLWDLFIGGDETVYSIVLKGLNHRRVGMRSNESGEKWEKLNLPTFPDTLVGLIDVGESGVMALMDGWLSDGVLLYSGDNGDTFQEAEEGLPDGVIPIELMCEFRGTVFLRTNMGCYRSIADTASDTAGAVAVDREYGAILTRIYPNPATREVTIVSGGLAGREVDVRFVADDGTTHLRERRRASADGSLRIKVDQLPTGHYSVMARGIEDARLVAVGSVVIVR